MAFRIVLDQAILKYENTNLSKETKIVIMGFVPETITRVQLLETLYRVWKY